MDMSSLIGYKMLGVPLLAIIIFSIRIIDVSVGTMRIIFLSRGMRFIPPVLGFFEVLIWLFAVSQVVRNLNTPILFVSYAAGYATGNYIGIMIENKIRLGMVILRIVTRRDASKAIGLLRSENYGVTKVEAEGAQGRVHLIFMVLKRKDVPRAVSIVESLHPHAFFTVEDVREVHEGIFPPRRTWGLLNALQRK
jgi:uncharacterized protein YebE (UPF0316 family)